METKDTGLNIYKPFLFIFVFGLMLFFSNQYIMAENIPFAAYNDHSLRPSAPTNLRIIGINGSSVQILSYQSILDDLSSDNHEIREKAAVKLYDERKKHSYSVDLIIPKLKDDSNRVSQYISSVLVFLANKNPGISKSLYGYYQDILDTYRASEDPFTLANCVALLSLATDDFNHIKEIILSSLRHGSDYEFKNAAVAVSRFSPKSIEIYRALADQIPYKKDSQTVIAEAMVNIALQFRDNTEGYNANRLLDGRNLMKKNVPNEFNRQISIIESIAATIFSRTDGSHSFPLADNAKTLRVGQNFDWSLFDSSQININGQKLSIEMNKKLKEVRFLGNHTQLIEGLNIIDNARIRYRVWIEGDMLRLFSTPYKKSYAVISAIDEYKKTGYETLGNMVENAEGFRKQLMRLGFPSANIFTLYNEDATSYGIIKILKEFWQGGKYADADRVIFYFGGHGNYVKKQTGSGNSLRKTGYLITADHDKDRPTLSSLLMKSLTGEHFENIVSNHVLMLIDSCSSGLALPRFQSKEKDKEILEKFKKYVVIESEIKRPARNIIVAGTGSQEALWENGGIFTTALNQGLSGKADFNKDWVIEFDELALYIKNKVRAKARSTGVEQEPRSFKATSYGEGSIIFLGN